MNSAPSFKLSLLFWIGLAVLAVGIGPLLLIGLAAAIGIGDPNPNPIGPGLLAFFTFWPAVILMGAGLIVSLARHRAARQKMR
jgi:hypothetical protein